MVKRKMTNSEMLNTTEKKIKIEPFIVRSHEMIIVQNQVLIYQLHQPHQKARVNSASSTGKRVLAPVVAPVVLLS